MTPEQQRAMAIAAARLRLKQKQQEAPTQAAKPDFERFSLMPQVAKDAMNLLGSGYTYGVGNKLSGGVEETEAARQRLGTVGTGLELAGGIASPNLLGKARGVGKVARAGWHGLEGGAGAALQAYTGGAPLSELPGEFAKGAGVSAALSRATQPMLKWLERRKLKAAQPFNTDADLKAAKAKEYADVDASKAIYRGRDLRSLHAQLAQMDLVPGVDDAAINALKKLGKDWKGKNMTAAELDKAQQFIRQKVGGTPNLQRISGDMVDAMRKFEKNTPLVDRVVDPATGRVSYKPASQDVKKSLETGRDYAAREQRLKSVNRMERRAQTQHRASRFNPFGQSLESARVKQAAQLGEKITEGKTKTSPFTKQETAGVKQLAEGTPRRNIGGAAEHLSFSGKMLPALSVAASAIPGLGPVATGTGALISTGAEALHRFGQKATTREIEDLQALIRDPSGRGLRSDPATINAAKDKLAKLMASGYRTTVAEREKR